MSFTSTYSSLSSRGFQGSGSAQQFYSLKSSQAGITAPSGQPTDFGISVDISEYTVDTNNLVIIGASGWQPSFIIDPGAVFFSTFTGLSSPIVGLGAIDALGGTVTITPDANYAVGSASEPGGAGYVQVYQADAFKNYTTQQTLVSPYVGEFGYASAINDAGNILALQARADTVANIASVGSVVTFTRSGNTWTEQQRIFANDISNANSNGRGFGTSISMNANGDCLAIGANFDSNSAGAVYIFTYSGNTWTQSAKIIASDRANDDSFGESCSLTENADYLVVGATNAGVGDIGAAYVYSNVGNTWTETAILSPTSNVVTPRAFGYRTFISNTSKTVVVSDFDSILISNSVPKGSVYVFTGDGSSYNQTQEIVNPGTYTGTGTFGVDMAATSDGTKLAISDLSYKSGNTKLGIVYLYQSFF